MSLACVRGYILARSSELASDVKLSTVSREPKQLRLAITLREAATACEQVFCGLSQVIYIHPDVLHALCHPPAPVHSTQTTSGHTAFARSLLKPDAPHAHPDDDLIIKEHSQPLRYQPWSS